MFRGSVKGTGYPLHSSVSPSLPLPWVTVCHHVSTGHCRWFYLFWNTCMAADCISVARHHSIRSEYLVNSPINSQFFPLKGGTHSCRFLVSYHTSRWYSIKVTFSQAKAGVQIWDFWRQIPQTALNSIYIAHQVQSLRNTVANIDKFHQFIVSLRAQYRRTHETYLTCTRENIYTTETHSLVYTDQSWNMLKVVLFLLGDSPASEFYVPTFRNTVCPIFIGAPCLHHLWRWNKQSVSKRRHKIQTPGIHQKERIQHSKRGESLKSRILNVITAKSSIKSSSSTHEQWQTIFFLPWKVSVVAYSRLFTETW